MISSNVWLAMIAAIAGIASPMMLSWLTNRNRRSEKEEDYKRQDEVARRAAQVEKDQSAKLDAIHTLANSAYTAAMTSEMDAITREIVLMQEVIELKKEKGTAPNPEVLMLLESARKKVEELKASILLRTEADKKAADKLTGMGTKE